VANRTELLFNEVLNSLQQVTEGRPSSATNGNMKVPELNHILELEAMLQKEKAEFEVRCHLSSSAFLLSG